MKPLVFAWRALRREFRHGELTILALALVLAVAALGAVSTLGARIEQSIVASAAELMGGDLGVSARTPLPVEWRNEAQQLGLSSAASAEFPSVLFAGDKSRMCNIVAVDATYPLRGILRVRDVDGREHSANAPPSGSVFVEHEVLTALGLQAGGGLALGDQTLRIAGEILSQPDGGQMFALAPRVLIGLPDAQSSGLLGPGSRVRHKLMLAGAADALARFRDWVKPLLPAGAELVTLEQSQQNLRTAFDRGTSFLRLAALLSALLSGIAVALAAQRFARRKTDEVALLRCLGASRREVLLALLLELLLLALPACIVGVLLGLGLQAGVLALAKDLLPGALPALPLLPSLAAFGVGIAVLIGFAMPPLLRLREVPPVRVFQRELATKSRRFDALYLLPVIVSAGLIYAQSDSLKLAAILAGSLLAVAALTWLLGIVLIRLCLRLARHLPGALRFGLANLARRRGLSLIQSTALSLSLTALFIMALVGPQLLQAWRTELPTDTPNYFLLNLQAEQRDVVVQKLESAGARGLNILPLAVGKLIAINGRVPKVEDYPDSRAANWINGETRISWSTTLPESNALVSGSWFDTNTAEPQLSVDTTWAEMFHLQLGDRMSLRVGERDIVATIRNIRKVNWNSFRVNFFLLLDPANAQSLPHGYVASFYEPPQQQAQLASLTHDYANLSLIDINALLDRVRDLIGRVSSAAQWVLVFSLIAGLLVLTAALNTTSDERRFEAALLRTLGARRGQLNAAVLGEFGFLGALSGVIAALGASATGVLLARNVFDIGFVPPLLGLGAGIIAAMLLVTLAGWLGTRARITPMSVLQRG